MAVFVENATLDGVSPFTLMGREFNFDGAFLGYLSLFNPDAGNSYTFNLSLTGAPWTIATLRFSGFNMALNLTDANDGQERRIDYLRLGPGDNVIDVNATRIRHIQGFDTENNRIELGAGRVTSIELQNGNDTVVGGSGEIRSVGLGNGDDRFTAGTGWVAFLETGSGNDRVTVGQDGRVGSVDLGSGNDIVTVSGNGRIESLRGFDGNKTITLSGDARIAQMQLGGGTNTVTLTDTARIFSLKMDSGSNVVTTGQGFLESFYSFDANNTLTFNGGVGQVTLSADSAVRHTIVANEFLGSLQVFDNARTTVTLAGYSQSINTSGGNDRITVTNTGYVETLRTGAGDDVVQIGRDGSGFINLGDGNDVIRITAMAPDRGVYISGGAGIDTLDMARIGQGVDVDLSKIGTFQNIGAPGGDIGAPGVIGYVSIGQVENMKGTKFDDALTGRLNANQIDGNVGNDRIFGLDGADTLIGGKGRDLLDGGADNDTLRGGEGNDTLRGGTGDDRLAGDAGADRFLFGNADGRDRITGFEIGLDRIGFDGVTSLGEISFAAVSGGVRLEVGETTVLVEGVTLAQLQAVDNFLF